MIIDFRQDRKTLYTWRNILYRVASAEGIPELEIGSTMKEKYGATLFTVEQFG